LIYTKGKEIPTDLYRYFYRDPIFYWLLLVPVPIWILMFFHTQSFSKMEIDNPLLIILFYPLLEETIFRGILQPWLARRFTHTRLNISLANLITSSIFAATHLFQQPILLALATFFPSLIFGYSQERYRRLMPPIILHITYNGGYFLLGVEAFRNPIPF